MSVAMRLHFVGIGGIGMSGIAQVFRNQGYAVTGSDLSTNDSTRKLEALGIKVFHQHLESNVEGADVVVISSAVKNDNPEVKEAKRLKIPVIPRAEALAELMRGKTGIAVAGTHGKTTTTTMIATVLSHAGFDPTLVVGGKVDSFGGNAKLGQGKFIVAEADESDASFLHLPATYSVITNIDNDHLDFYKNISEIEEAFIQFVAKIPFYGAVAVCGDDPGVKRCLSRFTKPYVTYGFNPENDYVISDCKELDFGSSFQVSDLGEFEIHSLGKHNILNACAAIAICHKLGLTLDQIKKGLAQFQGVHRRFQIKYRDEKKKMLIVDDYGHHPTEILATLAAARSYWKGRILAVFQPHRYSRTLHSRDGFLSSFKDCDQLFLTEIYSAGEPPIEGISGSILVDSIRAVSPTDKKIHFTPTLEDAATSLLGEFKENDLLICFGAGSITKLPEMIIQKIKS